MMAEMPSLRSYEENHDMEQLGQKLMCTTLKLEKLKAESQEEMMKNKDYILQLIKLLKLAIQERDDARNEFQKLLKTRANASITESNSLSETYNLPSHGLSPVASPDFSNINLAQDFVPDSNSVLKHNHVDSCPLPKLDQASLIIDNLAKAAILPQKGKFLQTVLQAGPLLNTLLVAGRLPRWQNPPQFQSFQMPSFSIEGCESEVLYQKPVSNFGQSLSCGSAQVHLGPTLNFETSKSSGSLNTHDYAPLAKRLRFS